MSTDLASPAGFCPDDRSPLADVGSSTSSVTRRSSSPSPGQNFHQGAADAAPVRTVCPKLEKGAGRTRPFQRLCGNLAKQIIRRRRERAEPRTRGLGRPHGYARCVGPGARTTGPSRFPQFPIHETGRVRLLYRQVGGGCTVVTLRGPTAAPGRRQHRPAAHRAVRGKSLREPCSTRSAPRACC